MTFFEEQEQQPVKLKTSINKKEKVYKKDVGNVSYSQYSTWAKCPYSWYLDKIKKYGKFESSISTVFGTSIHEPIQEYLDRLFNQGAPAADNFDYMAKYKETFLSELFNVLEKESLEFEKSSVAEHIEDGKGILKEVLTVKNRQRLFSTSKYELLGIETEIEIEVAPGVFFTGFMDVLLRNKEDNTIKILDIKTSSNGWNKWQLADPLKTDQLLLYKRFYSKKFNVSEDEIEVEFLILRRKLQGFGDFKYQSRIQTFKPTQGKAKTNQAQYRFDKFVGSCFTLDGKKNENGVFPMNPGRVKKNCKYCPFADMVVDGVKVCKQKQEDFDLFNENEE